MFQIVCDSSFGLMRRHLEKVKGRVVSRRAELQKVAVARE